MSNQQQQHDELEERTVSVLNKVQRFLTKEEFSLLCFHCGMDSKDFAIMPTKDEQVA